MATDPVVMRDYTEEELEQIGAEMRAQVKLAQDTLKSRSERVSAMRRALVHSRGWLSILASERPKGSDIHAVLAEVDAAIALDRTDPVSYKQGKDDNG